MHRVFDVALARVRQRALVPGQRPRPARCVQSVDYAQWACSPLGSAQGLGWTAMMRLSEWARPHCEQAALVQVLGLRPQQALGPQQLAQGLGPRRRMLVGSCTTDCGGDPHAAPTSQHRQRQHE